MRLQWEVLFGTPSIPHFGCFCLFGFQWFGNYCYIILSNKPYFMWPIILGLSLIYCFFICLLQVLNFFIHGAVLCFINVLIVLCYHSVIQYIQLVVNPLLRLVQLFWTQTIGKSEFPFYVAYCLKTKARQLQSIKLLAQVVSFFIYELPQCTTTNLIKCCHIHVHLFWGKFNVFLSLTRYFT